PYPYFVQKRKVLVEVHNVTCGLHAMLEAAAGGFKYGLEVRKRLRCLRGKSPFHHPVALFCIPRRGTRTEYQIAELHCLHQRRSGDRRLVRMDHFLFHARRSSNLTICPVALRVSLQNVLPRKSGPSSI